MNGDTENNDAMKRYLNAITRGFACDGFATTPRGNGWNMLPTGAIGFPPVADPEWASTYFSHSRLHVLFVNTGPNQHSYPTKQSVTSQRVSHCSHPARSVPVDIFQHRVLAACHRASNQTTRAVLTF